MRKLCRQKHSTQDSVESRRGFDNGPSLAARMGSACRGCWACSVDYNENATGTVDLDSTALKVWNLQRRSLPAWLAFPATPVFLARSLVF